jgi:hypothetical protein
VKIVFNERPIHRAPLAVLEHLYYYTAQYGLSVRQFTGRHWRYWENLPKSLRDVQNDPEGLESVIVELEQLAADSEIRLERRRAQIREGKWEEKEIVLNAQLLSVLAALPAQLLALGFRILVREESLPQSLRIVDLHMEGDAGEHVDFLEPDLLLLGDRCLLMVEIKTRGGVRSSRSYPPHQLLNYLQLVAECREAQDAALPAHFVHLILVPSVEPRWLEGHSDWVREIHDAQGRLNVDPDACIRLSKRKASYDYEQLRELATEIPIYCQSWDQLCEAFQSAIQVYDDSRNRSHWRRIADEIGELANRASRYS